MRRILMCPPDHYGIEYEINPWMSRARAVDPARARAQWEALHALITGKLEVKVSLLSPGKGHPDLVFTANAGLVHGRIFVPSRFRPPERRTESPLIREWFEGEGYSIRDLPGEAYFEGEGDLLRVGKERFAGYRIRTDIRSHAAIGSILDFRVLSLELVDPAFYHLDTCFCPLGEDAAAWYPDAMDAYARKVVEAHVPRLFEVDRAEAMRFACNAVVTGRRVVVNAGCDRFKEALTRNGYEVWETELSEFVKAGGAAKCLALWLD